MPSGLFGNQWNNRIVIHCEGLCWALQGIWQFCSLPTKCQYVSPQSLGKPTVPHHSSFLPRWGSAHPTESHFCQDRNSLCPEACLCFCLSPLLKVHRETKPHRNPKVTHEAPSLAMYLLLPLRSTHGFYTLVIVSPRLCSKSSNCSSVSSVTKKSSLSYSFTFIFVSSKPGSGPNTESVSLADGMNGAWYCTQHSPRKLLKRTPKLTTEVKSLFYNTG